jgi:hypothetical protein
LKNALGKTAEYISLPDYSFSRTFSKRRFSKGKFFLLIPYFMAETVKEKKAFDKLQAQHKFEMIITDARYGIYKKGIPSYYINHHIKYPVGGLTAFLNNTITESLSYSLIRVPGKFKKLLIPDLEKRGGLGGGMTHGFLLFKPKHFEYLGHLSMMTRKDVKPDIDYFFSISGPEPQRTVFEKKVMAMLPKIRDKKIVVTLGVPEAEMKSEQKGNVTIYNFLDSKKQEEIMNRSKLVIARSGYSTIMDLYELGKKALLMPTAGQPEQEYLVKYLTKNKYFYCTTLKKLDLPHDLYKAEQYPGFAASAKTADSVEKFLRIVGL